MQNYYVVITLDYNRQELTLICNVWFVLVTFLYETHTDMQCIHLVRWISITSQTYADTYGTLCCELLLAVYCDASKQSLLNVL